MILIGSVSLMAFPYLTGFYSKDLILELIYDNYLIYCFCLLTLGAHAQRGLQYLVCHSVCLSVRHVILAVCATKSITKDTIVLSVRFAAILK